MNRQLTLALSKGRILEEALPLLERIGLAPAGDIDRKLRVPAQDPRVSLLIIRPSDVPTYVEYGAADFGIVGDLFKIVPQVVEALEARKK